MTHKIQLNKYMTLLSKFRGGGTDIWLRGKMDFKRRKSHQVWNKS